MKARNVRGDAVTMQMVFKESLFRGLGRLVYHGMHL